MYRLFLLALILMLAGCQPGADLQDHEHQEELTFLKKGLPVLTYQKGIRFPADSLPRYYQRSGFIHPLYTPGGKILTDDFPEGHTHQHGLFFALVNTTYRGKSADFWNQQNGTGTVRFARLIDSTSDGFRALHEHLAIHNGDTLVALNERWDVQIADRKDMYLIDLISRLYPNGNDTLHVNKYHYGGLGFRGNAEWNDLEFEQPGNVNYIGRKGKGGFHTSSGKTRMDGNHSHERWVSFHGIIDGDSAGVVIMSHPSNFRYPQAVRLHPVMPYFSFSPMVNGAFDLLPGDTLVSRYRIITHDGAPGKKWIEEEWESFAELK